MERSACGATCETTQSLPIRPRSPLRRVPRSDQRHTYVLLHAGCRCHYRTYFPHSTTTHAPDIVIVEVGTAHVDATGAVSTTPDAPGPEISASARTGPHVTLHRSGACHVRAIRETPLIELNYGKSCPMVNHSRGCKCSRQLLRCPLREKPKIAMVCYTCRTPTFAGHQGRRAPAFAHRRVFAVRLRVPHSDGHRTGLRRASNHICPLSGASKDPCQSTAPEREECGGLARATRRSGILIARGQRTRLAADTTPSITPYLTVKRVIANPNIGRVARCL
jgi:hypothetical protein